MISEVWEQISIRNLYKTALLLLSAKNKSIFLLSCTMSALKYLQVVLGIFITVFPLSQSGAWGEMKQEHCRRYLSFNGIAVIVSYVQ